MVVGSAVALVAGALIAVVLFFCAFGILKQVRLRALLLQVSLHTFNSNADSAQTV